MIQLLEATPVFVDIDPKTFNLDPEVLNPLVEAPFAAPACTSVWAQYSVLSESRELWLTWAISKGNFR